MMLSSLRPRPSWFRGQSFGQVWIFRATAHYHNQLRKFTTIPPQQQQTFSEFPDFSDDSEDMIPFEALEGVMSVHSSPSTSAAPPTPQQRRQQQSLSLDEASLPPKYLRDSALVQRAWKDTEGRIARLSSDYPELTPEKIREIDSAVDELFAYTMLPRGVDEGRDTEHLEVWMNEIFGILL